ncbi:MAG: hypothetical protein IKV88_02515, partial [Clostridia bacterium]|nr:hypothetical protein [Clostridia bacterium]
MKNLRLIKDIYKASPGRIWLEMLAIVGQLLNSMLVQVILVKVILDLVISGEFQKAIFVVLFAVVADFVFSVFERWMNYVYRKKDNIRLHEQFQKKLYQGAVKVRLTYYDNPEYYDQFILAAKNGDIQAIQFLDTLKEGIVKVAEILISGGLIVTNLNSL